MLNNCAKNWTAWTLSCSNRSQRDCKLTFTIIAALGFTARRARAWLTGGRTLKTEKQNKRLLVV